PSLFNLVQMKPVSSNNSFLAFCSIVSPSSTKPLGNSHCHSPIGYLKILTMPIRLLESIGSTATPPPVDPSTALLYRPRLPSGNLTTSKYSFSHRFSGSLYTSLS